MNQAEAGMRKSNNRATMSFQNKTTTFDGSLRLELAQGPAYNPPTTSQSFPSELIPASAYAPARKAAPSRLRQGLKRVALIGSGISLGIVLTLFVVQQLQQDTAVETAAAPTQIDVQVSAPVENAVSETEILAQAIPSEETRTQLAELEDWFAAQPVPVAQRKFLSSASRGGKSLDQQLERPEQPTSTRQVTNNYDFSRSAQANGRYSLRGDSVEWQGGWQLNNPVRNVQTAQQYQKYVTNELGSKMGGELRSFRHPSGEILRRATQSLAPLR